MRTRILKTGLLLAVMATGIFLRFYRLDNQSLWWDEGYSWCLAKDFDEGGFKAFLPTYQGYAQALSTDKTQPLFHILVAFLPDSWSPEWKMRFWPALAGSLSLFLIWALAIELYKRFLVAFIILLVAALSPFLIYYSQEGRPYALQILFVLIFLYFNNRQVKSGKNYALIKTIFIVLIGITQFIGLIIPLSAAIVNWHFQKQQFKSTAIQGMGLLCILICLMPILFLVILHREAPIPSQGVSSYNIAYSIYAFIIGFSFGPSTNELHFDKSISSLIRYWPQIVLIGFMGVTLSFFGLRFNVVNCYLRNNIQIMFLSLLFLLMAFVLSFIPLYPRHLSVLAPIFLICIGGGIYAAPHKFIKILLGLTLIILMIWSDYNYFNNSKYHKDDLRAAAKVIQQNERLGDIIKVGPKEAFLPYYIGINRVERILHNDASFINNLQFEQSGRRIWVIMSRQWEFDRNGLKDQFLGKEHTYMVFDGLKIYLI